MSSTDKRSARVTAILSAALPALVRAISYGSDRPDPVRGPERSPEREQYLWLGEVGQSGEEL